MGVPVGRTRAINERMAFFDRWKAAGRFLLRRALHLAP
jgi:hypothetical protein